MKVKTSITLSQDILHATDRISSRYQSRSELIGTVMRAFLSRLEGEERDRKDLEMINRNSDRLNQEAADVLKYQVEL